MQFSKMHGLGNDFMVIDGVTQSVFLTDELIRKLADRLKGLTDKQDIKVSTANGKMVLSLQEDGQVRVNMGKPIWEPAKVPFIANKFEKNYLLRTELQTAICGVVSMGNPHAVLQVENVQAAPVNELGPLLENHERFPERANIGFMQVVNRHHIKLRVFERGAGETQACGSGACAAAAVGIMQGALDSPVRVDLNGKVKGVRFI